MNLVILHLIDPNKGKSASKMIKRLNAEDLFVVYGSDLSDSDDILYEFSSQFSESSDSDEDICMMQFTPHQDEESFNIKLSSVIGEEVQFMNEQLIQFAKLQKLKKEEVYETSKVSIFSKRILEQFSGDSTIDYTSTGKHGFNILNNDKVAIWRQQNPLARYIHMGMVQIKITSLFCKGTDQPILALVMDNRFHNPIDAFIGGIQSTLVNNVIWFQIKPNYFISLTDPNIEKVLQVKLQLSNLKMVFDSPSLGIQWKVLYELTREPETATIPIIDSKLVTLFEPRPFDSVIEPKLLKWTDLEIPRN
ncbi:uncharacterized protein LOC132296595 [Cornus florida]|uniref:uncharacterized protein LOC132296595 n=1 Tax=Cornus florida TaxID=4283 RepID=UPI002897093A|nr:uncharacterized protein LOC132296595 [Cornus florida]